MKDAGEPSVVANFPIARDEFLKFRDFFYRKIGMHFEENKRYFVDRRLAERARIVGCQTFREYFTLLRLDAAGRELEQLINLLTVNETYFFREDYQFTSLVDHVLPEVATRKRPGQAIKIWSLPCSTGEEPYSIAMTVLDRWPPSDTYAIEILGSDIDTRVLNEAKAGRYGERALQRAGRDVRARYFNRIDALTYEIIPELRESIDFAEINLSDKAQMRRYRDYDVIFCRNLLIYFDDVSRREAVESLFEALVPGGFLFLGHSENMSRMSSLFTPRKLGDCIVYQRPLDSR